MRNKFIIALALGLASCVANSSTPLVVTEVKRLSESPKYQVLLNHDVYVVTDSLYNVGDTLK